MKIRMIAIAVAAALIPAVVLGATVLPNALPPRGTVVGTDIVPDQPALSSQVQAATASGLAAYVSSFMGSQTYPAPTLPLAGTEVTPCIQTGGYKRCTVANIAAYVLISPPPAPILVSALPTCTAALEGSRRSVSDANSPSYLAPVYGGGTVHASVGCNGTAWVTGY